MEVSRRRYQSSKRLSNKQQGLAPLQRERDVKLNLQRRQKLAFALIEQISNKINGRNDKDIIQKEVEELLKKEIVNERDLKELEKKIKNKIRARNEKEKIRNELINRQVKGFQEENIKGDENVQKEEENLNESDMSGASDLDKFDEKSQKEREREEKFQKYKNCLCLKGRPIRPKADIKFDEYKNEWDALTAYNIHKMEEREKNEKIQNWETKMRTRTYLKNQINDKIKKEYEEELKKKEYDEVMKKHLAS